MISAKKGLMKTEITMRSKEIFVLNYLARPKKNILVILMSKLFLTTKFFLKSLKPFFSIKAKAQTILCS